MFCGDLYRLVKTRAFNHVETGNPLFGFGEWPIRFQDLAVSFANGDGLIHPDETVTGDSDSLAGHLGNPGFDIVLLRIVWFGRGISAHEHQVSHGRSLPHVPGRAFSTVLRTVNT